MGIQISARERVYVKFLFVVSMSVRVDRATKNAKRYGWDVTRMIFLEGKHGK